MGQLDTQVEELKKKIKEISSKRREKIEGKKSGHSNLTVGEEFREQVEEINKLRKEKKGIYDEMNMCQTRLDQLAKEKQLIAGNIHPQYTTLDSVKKGIRALEKRIETETLNKAAED